MSEISISEEAKLAALEIFPEREWCATKAEHMLSLNQAEVACQKAINSATAPLNKWIEELEKEDWTASLCDRVNELLREHPCTVEITNGEHCSNAIRTIHGYCGALKQERYILSARVKELEKDKERLDWLENPAPNYNFHLHLIQRGIFEGMALRHAIDTAILATIPKE